MDGAVLALRGIRKRFGAVQAVDGVDLTLAPGEIHALVGENGAGKSTLAAIAYGSVVPDEGTVDARGTVGLVHQHFLVIERLRVWENVLLGREPRRGLQIDVAAARARVRSLATAHGLDVDPDARIETLPVAIRQRVELLRELARDPAILVLDEPTAALAPSEIAAFFSTVQALARGGTAVLIVTHKLAEVIAYTQRVTVMRAGTIVARYVTAETSAEAIARAMVGGAIPPLAERAATSGAVRFAVRDLHAGSGSAALQGASFEIHAGEIVGIAGIEGNGQSALADAIAGVCAYDGSVALDGTTFGSGDGTSARIARGMRVIPQDRLHEALVLDWSVRENAVLGRQRTPGLQRRGIVDRGAARAFAQTVIERFDVRPPNAEGVAGFLSGGNQQKIVVGRALASDPTFVLAYQPTRGIDIGASTLVQSRLIEARNAGVAILLISFELDEIFSLADRVFVLFDGRLSESFARGAIDRGRIGELMAGGT